MTSRGESLSARVTRYSLLASLLASLLVSSFMVETDVYGYQRKDVAAIRAANSFSPLKCPLSSMTIRHFCTNHSPNVARHPRAMRQADAPRRALSEPPRPFFRAGNRSASRSERLRGRGRREERKPSLPKKQTRANGGVRKWGRIFSMNNSKNKAQYFGLVKRKNE